jgi:cytochrome b
LKAPPQRKVWDPLVRSAHWLLALAVAAAWWTRAGWGRTHEWLGYATLLLVVLRVLWGVVGSRDARFAQFVRGPSTTLHYAREVLAGHERRHVGHNPLGAWMIVALLAVTALAGITGWIYTTDAFWGDARIERLHAFFATALLVLVPLHVAGVLVASWRHRENLAAAMVHGRKRAAQGDDIAQDAALRRPPTCAGGCDSNP